MMSFDKPEERKILDDFLKNRDIKKSDITKQVVEDLQEFREAVIFANPFNTSTANSKMDNIEEVVSYLAINNISAGMKESDAIEKATRQITDNFKIQDTYFIPKRYNNKNLSQGQIDFVIEKQISYKKSI
jgi:PBP1b-binding outer membrane lipoprotein LpoB